MPEPGGGGGLPLPPHAYVPGQTPRHPEGYFDPLIATLPANLPPEALHQSALWRAALAYFDQGYYWEAHELLEPIWMRCPEASAERRMVQALIQLANARLKLRMQRPRAAARICIILQDLLEALPGTQRVLGVDPVWIQLEMRKIEAQLPAV